MAAKEVAIQKRAQIDKATQTMLVAVGFASVVLGCAIVLSIYFVKQIRFNAEVIGEKDTVIKNYEKIQSNVENLASNVRLLEDDENLEVMARVRDENRCTTFEGDLIDTTDNVGLARICSALRVIPDALPAVQTGSEPNREAAYGSLNKLFLETLDEDGNPVQPYSIGPGGSGVAGTNIEIGLNMIPVALIIENTATTAKAVLDTIERSIRNYDIQTMTIAWQGGDRNEDAMLEMRGSAVAYYLDAVTAELKTKVIYADKSKAGTATGTGVRQ